jgi:rubrerythrin
MRRAVVHLVTPIVWRIPGHGARKLYGFARAEQGSRIDLLRAAHRTPSAARRALYLRHALDETRHASMFWRRSSDLRGAAGAAPYPPPVADTEQLFDRLGEVGFLAFVHRGERRGRQQFERYAQHFEARGDARTRALFDAILLDERRHESYTRELLVELAGGEQPARAALRRAALWEAWRMWRRAGRALASAIYALAMIAIYLVAGIVAAVATRLAARTASRRGRRHALWHAGEVAQPAEQTQTRSPSRSPSSQQASGQEPAPQQPLPTAVAPRPGHPREEA